MAQPQDIYQKHFLPFEQACEPPTPLLLTKFMADHYPKGMSEPELTFHLQQLLRGLVALKRREGMQEREPMIRPGLVTVEMEGIRPCFRLVGGNGKNISVNIKEKLVEADVGEEAGQDKSEVVYKWETIPCGPWGVGLLFFQLAYGDKFPQNISPKHLLKLKKNLTRIIGFKLGQNEEQKNYCRFHEEFMLYRKNKYRKICTKESHTKRMASRSTYLRLHGLAPKETMWFSKDILKVVYALLKADPNNEAADGPQGTSAEWVILTLRFLDDLV